ncbi:ABC transporter substrate-binding protein [Rhodovarius crocodyli]|uniref:ABC transporter substrate-binding protein n=1 Tax=Rhodovarius crocodyli TaxID=1979269 RepID=A0A437MNP6_9PROT|nr:ABC transporter substrate-binding protein [Rhodovarius crocodyli]RVT99257.1 ABC transporter substrate-binding protein [Rhodovarius crocodyli]
MTLPLSRRALAMGAVAAAAPAAAQQPTALTIATGGSVTSLDPHYFNAAPNSALATHFFDTFTRRDATAQIVPNLAESWRVVEPTIWEFKLRAGVKWHDGRPFTADDVVATVERVPNVPNTPSSFAGFLRSIARVEVVDPLTIRFHTRYPNPILSNDLASVFIISRHAGMTTTEEYNSGRAVIGTGPYKFVSHSMGDRTVMERNPEYWAGPQPWERVTYRFIANDAARTAALIAGDIDVIDQVASSDLERLKRDNRVRVAETEGLRVVYLMPDYSRTGPVPGVTDNAGTPLPRNPFHDVRVRQALNIAIARDAIASRIMEGQATATRQWLPPGTFGYVNDLRPAAADVDGAKRLLAAAGFPQGFKLVLTTPNDRFPNDSRIAQAVAQAWTRIGVQTTVEALPWSSFSTRGSRQEFGMRLTSWGSSPGEASYTLANILHTYDRERRTGASNAGRFSSPELDAMTQRAQATMDDDDRRRQLEAAVRWVAENAPIMPVVQLMHSWASKRNLVVTPRMDERTTALEVKPA